MSKKNHNHTKSNFLAIDEGQGPCSVTVKLFDNASDFFLGQTLIYKYVDFLYVGCLIIDQGQVIGRLKSPFF